MQKHTIERNLIGFLCALNHLQKKHFKCSQSCSKIVGLKNHERKHTGEKSIRCLGFSPLFSVKNTANKLRKKYTTYRNANRYLSDKMPLKKVIPKKLISCLKKWQVSKKLGFIE
jgi:hypothetical protein